MGPHHARSIAALCFISISYAYIHAQSYALQSPPPLIEELHWQEVCAQSLASPLTPAVEALAASSQSAEAKCDEHALYYGFGRAPDYAAALRCAYQHRAHPAIGSFMEGPATLSMLYANGYGVPRDYSLAIRFACEIQNSAGGEAALRIGRLEALRDCKLAAGARFDLCDTAMSGSMGAYCSGIAEEQADAVRARRLQAIERKLTQEASAAFPQLQAVEKAFEEARLHGEYTGGDGSGSAGFATDDQNRLREQFVINLERFAAGNVPPATAADRQKSQQDLNSAWASVEALPADPNASSMAPTPASYQATEDAWQGLFAEWMRFIPIAYPQLSPDAAATELIRLRLHQLRKIAR